MNTQPVEKRRHGAALEVHSIFPTIQGEGPFSGRAAIFVRLAGCNLQCPLCDTDYTSTRRLLTAAQVRAEVRSASAQCAANLVVITGGEPFRQELAPLFSLLLDEGYVVQVETNGTLPPPKLTGDFDYGTPESAGVAFDRMDRDVFIVVSPKTGSVHKLIDCNALAYKYVLKADNVDTDGLPITVLDHTAQPRVARPVRSGVPIYVQPCDEHNTVRNARNTRAAVESALRYGYILQQQLHKQVGVE